MNPVNRKAARGAEKTKLLRHRWTPMNNSGKRTSRSYPCVSESIRVSRLGLNQKKVKLWAGPFHLAIGDQ